MTESESSNKIDEFNKILKLDLTYKKKIFKNIKTGILYEVINIGYSSSNNNEGKIMVVYKRILQLKDTPFPIFVREFDEFLEKFKIFRGEV